MRQRRPIERLSDVPSRSLLSRITDHYMQIIANQAPIGFEAEFVNQRGATILYRGILLPFSSDDDTIDFIYGVINWKELADQADHRRTAAANRPGARRLRRSQRASRGRSPNGRTARRTTRRILDLTVRADEDDDAIDWPQPGFGGGAKDDDVLDLVEPLDEATRRTKWASPTGSPRPANSHRRHRAARNARARRCMARLAGAHDFAIAAAAAPGEFEELLADAGLTAQERAPLTPVVKLVFGVDYDKTRLTEYASALAHAQRLGIGRGDAHRLSWLRARAASRAWSMPNAGCAARKAARPSPRATPRARRSPASCASLVTSRSAQWPPRAANLPC
jgi:hypothetical protein